MRVGAKAMRTIWPAGDGAVEIIDQTLLPHELKILRLTRLDEVAHAIKSMQVRGAPLIGATAAYGVALAIRAGHSLDDAIATLAATRPTAVNLHWALERMRRAATSAEAAFAEAAAIADEDVAINRAIGEHGAGLIAAAHRPKGARVEILTHCNAGWLATVDWGTALAPIYRAFDDGVPLHVWVDETRPRNQGASLTAWELLQHGVPHTVIADNAGGHLMRQGMVDLCITGTDRTAANGDVANKIGTYLKALAARDNNVPFYVALPSSTLDWTLADGVAEIPIEERDQSEVGTIAGQTEDGRVARVRVIPPGSRAANPAFDVTPARLVSGLITERGRCAASEQGLLSLFPERSA
ncbi:MAG TPA: S-methyl-5-thioribose-1-phosphate isomerase [Stellaceae bacterium]|nr:S-methyl-5-thioribose-1-phosphate isomerase [Stellaceae bacterium]